MPLRRSEWVAGGAALAQTRNWLSINLGLGVLVLLVDTAALNGPLQTCPSPDHRLNCLWPCRILRFQSARPRQKYPP